MQQLNSALGALLGLAIGDALGMPTQSLPRDLIVSRYGSVISGFAAAPSDHPLAAGLAAGSVTDDTEQALILAELLVSSGGKIDPAVFATRLIAWEADMRERGSLDLLGPSTARALAELLAGADISKTGRTGTTNGAAMRIAPVGIAFAGKDILANVVLASSVTHNTGLALSGAAAVAAAVSAGVEGAGVEASISAGIDAASEAAGLGYWVAGADVAARIEWAVSLTAGRDVSAVIESTYRLIGTSLASQESVPAAFAILAAFPDDPWQVCRVAASVGGDCDTIAAMAGAIAGACHGQLAFPESARDMIISVNQLPLDALAEGLMAVRGTAAPLAR